MFLASLEGMQVWARGIMASRPPDFVIGENYLRRWWAMPRNDYLNVYIHEMWVDDDDRALHDHPWANTSIVLEGGYLEHTPQGVHERFPGDVVTRQAEDAHRLVLRRDGAGVIIPALTIFSTGPKVREWGFHCPKGWVNWREFTDERDTGKVGRGCGEMA
jgi:hypothetical protein